MRDCDLKFAIGARSFVFAGSDDLKKYDGQEVIILRCLDEVCDANSNRRYEVRLLYSNETFFVYETDLVG